MRTRVEASLFYEAWCKGYIFNLWSDISTRRSYLAPLSPHGLMLPSISAVRCPWRSASEYWRSTEVSRRHALEPFCASLARECGRTLLNIWTCHVSISKTHTLNQCVIIPRNLKNKERNIAWTYPKKPANPKLKNKKYPLDRARRTAKLGTQGLWPRGQIHDRSPESMLWTQAWSTGQIPDESHAQSMLLVPQFFMRCDVWSFYTSGASSIFIVYGLVDVILGTFIS